MSKYKVIVVGMGKRGKHHAAAFQANENFEVAGICDIDQARLDEAAKDLDNPQVSTDVAALTADIKPDVFCFCTMPHLREDFVRIGIDNGAKLIAFEKPVADSSATGMVIKNMLEGKLDFR